MPVIIDHIATYIKISVPSEIAMSLTKNTIFTHLNLCLIRLNLISDEIIGVFDGFEFCNFLLQLQCCLISSLVLAVNIHFFVSPLSSWST